MTRSRAIRAAGILLAAAALPGAAAAQSFVAQPQHYLLTTDVFDGRALWVQPAALARRKEASIALMVTADRAGGPLLLGQYGATLASGGLGLGWQHDEDPASSAKTDAFAVGFGFGGPLASVGVVRRWHRGTNTRDGAWDFGGRYRPGGAFELSLAWRDVGAPVVLGDTIFTTMVPGAAVQFFRARVQLGVDWELVTKGWGTSAFRAGVTVALPQSLGLGFRAELDPDFNARVLSVALSWHSSGARITGFGAAARGASPDRFGLWGSAVADPALPRRRRFGG